MNLIYGLVDPRTLLVRYVGLSSTGMKRPTEHRKPSRLRSTSYKNSWIKSLLAAGLDYTIAVLEAEPVDLTAAERFWIAYGRCLGWPLTNLTDGGDGLEGHIPTAETRAKISAAFKGRPRNPAAVLATATWHRGRKRSVATCARLAAAKRLDNAARNAARKGVPLSDEHRAKLSAAAQQRELKRRSARQA